MQQNSTNNLRKIFLDNAPLMDVRAPLEFEKGSIPGAVNLPLMDNNQREQVGICYKESGQKAAIDLGRQLVSLKIREQRKQKWLDFIENNNEGYLFCFRGGLRSKITQQWIYDAGIQYPYVEGGYKAMRQFLLNEIELQAKSAPLIILNGRTGTGKTWLLKKIERNIDLEGLANHRGSSFGNMIQNQPSVINFENHLSVSLLKLNKDQVSPVFVEGEGRMIGRVSIPKSFWKKMIEAPHIVLVSTLSERVEIAIQDYIIELFNGFSKKLTRDQALDMLGKRHLESLYRIRKRLGGTLYKRANNLLRSAIAEHKKNNKLTAYIPFVELLLTKYYDPMYDYQISNRSEKPLFCGTSDEIIQWSEYYLAKQRRFV